MSNWDYTDQVKAEAQIADIAEDLRLWNTSPTAAENGWYAGLISFRDDSDYQIQVWKAYDHPFRDERVATFDNIEDFTEWTYEQDRLALEPLYEAVDEFNKLNQDYVATVEPASGTIVVEFAPLAPRATAEFYTVEDFIAWQEGE